MKRHHAEFDSMNVEFSLKAWPTQKCISARDERSTNHSAHTALLRKGLNVHEKIL